MNIHFFLVSRLVEDDRWGGSKNSIPTVSIEMEKLGVVGIHKNVSLKRNTLVHHHLLVASSYCTYSFPHLSGFGCFFISEYFF